MSLLRKLSMLHLRQGLSFYSQGARRNLIRTARVKRSILMSQTVEICKAWYTKTLAKLDVSEKELEEMRNNLLRLENLKPSIVDSLILDVCNNEKYINSGISYYKYIEALDPKPSIVTTSKYLRLYEGNIGIVSEADREHILKVYRSIKEQFPSLDFVTANACIVSLCAIGEWQESIEIIKNFEEYDTDFLPIGYSALINYFYSHDQAELGYKYLEISCKAGCGPANYVYSTYFKYCLKERETFKENMEKLFNLWKKYDIKPSSKIVNECIEACEKVGWNAALAHITLSKCNTCGLKLSEQTLSIKEFKDLFKVVSEKLLVDNCYQVTSPTELTHFAAFIKKTAPYDIIIDGLNILLNAKTKNYRGLEKLITYFTSKNKKVLVIGRKHLLNLKPIKHLQSKATFYFVSDASQDDPFIIYSAMASGYNCKIVTQDFMRKQKFNLADNEMRVLFKRWQLSHQCMHLEDLMKPMQLNLVHSVNYSAQKQNEYWHIPYQSSKNSQRMHHTQPDEWMCLKMCT